ncbi:major facilitator superfamily transporter [Colletotrichum truncatum]|uniref:Major facilitator superfamily transporter n=1 Tax=Colletotrichum truncatum TaxID=5467 RepID=A0ACC3ZBU9_COLTU
MAAQIDDIPSPNNEASPVSSSQSITPEAPKPSSSHRGWRFWAIVISLAATAFLSSLEGAIISTALPSISRAVNAQEDYIWIVNVYFLTSSAAFQPLYGQVADIWGRRLPMTASLAIFTVGSGVCGGANWSSVLIGGRAVQGLGAAGINVLVEIILCDLLPLRERGQFMGMLFLFIILGSVLGPFLGGLMVDRLSWRWVFYLNLPISGVCLVLLFLVLKGKPAKGNESKTFDKLKEVDVIGLLIICASVTSLLYALTYGGGARYPWSSPVIIATLILGFLGLGLFFAYQESPWCSHPALPKSLFQNRTSLGGYMATFAQIMVSFGTLYFLPVYFQSTQLVSTSRSGVQLLPFSAVYCVAALAGGIIVSKLGKFRNVHVVSFALQTVAMGTFSLLDRKTSMATWVTLSLLAGIGLGLPNPSLLTAIQAELSDSLNAKSTSAFAFVRSISTVFAVTIPAAVLNSRFDQLLSVPGAVSDPSAEAALAHGQAYERASRDFVQSFPPPVQDHIISLYEESLKQVWYVLTAFAIVGFLASLVEKNLEARSEQTSEDFGLQQRVQTES